MMLRMKRRVMRRLVSICLIEMNRPTDKPSRRFLSGDQVLQTEPSGRYYLRNQRPEGFFQATGFVNTSLRDG
jgi:hypothetical protein